MAKNRLAHPIALAALLATAFSHASAATFHWEGDAGNNWDSATTWEENMAPPNDGTADVIFSNLGNPFPSIQPAYHIQSLTWTADANAFNYDTGPLTLGAGGFTQNGGNSQNFSTARVILSADQAWTLASGTGQLNFGEGLDLANFRLTLNAATTVESGNVISGDLAGAGALIKGGAGILTLAGTNTFSGGVTVDSGTLAVADDRSLGAAGNGVGLNAGRLQFTSDALTARTFILNKAAFLEIAVGSTLTLGSGGSVNGGSLGVGGTLAFTDGSALSETTALLDSRLTQPSGTASFDHVTVLGAFTQSSGATLDATGGLSLGIAGVLTVNGTTNLVNGAEFLGRTALNKEGTIAVREGSSLLLGKGSQTTINNGGTLSAALSGSGTPAGTIELNDGSLVNNGAQSGLLNVNAGGSAKGIGAFGTINVNEEGKFSPGNSPGNAETVGDFNLNASGRYEFELNKANYATSDGHADFLVVGGAIAANAGTATGSRFTIAIISLNAGNSPAPLTDFDAAQPYSFTLATAAGGVTGFDAAEFAVDTSAFGNALAGGTFTVGMVGNDLRLIFIPVPEPSTAGLLLASAVFARQRRR